MIQTLSIRRLLVATSILIATLLAGCSAMRAQNPSSALQPVNAVADGDDERVMLKGHDVVASSRRVATHSVRTSSRAFTRA